MRAIVVRSNYVGCPQSILALGNSLNSKIELTETHEYTVWALVKWRGELLLQVVNDIGYPDWFPAWLFTISEKSLPSNWLCNILEGEIGLIIGPQFLTENLQAYEAMVELAPAAVDAFWLNVKSSEENLR